jgi:hypothetical protein
MLQTRPRYTTIYVSLVPMAWRVGACLESGVGPAGEHGVAVAEEGEAGDVAVGRVGTMHVLAPARHVAPVLLAQHLRLGRQHLPHCSR